MSQLAFASTAGYVGSVVTARTNGPLLRQAALLWLRPEDDVLDVTYGKGRFWTEYRPANLTTHDLALDGVDFRALPELDASVDVVVFDPPYIPQGGREHMPGTFLDNFGLRDGPRSRAELEDLIRSGIAECARVLRPRGVVLAKCCDYVNGRQFTKGRHFMVCAAEATGLVQVDELVHVSGPGPGQSREPEDQHHSRRVHSFLCVFQKRPLGARRELGASAERPESEGA